MIKVSVIGAGGRMGRRILHLLAAEPDVEITGACEAPGNPELGADAGTLAGSGEIGVLLTDNIEEASESAEVIIDFTTPPVTLKTAAYATQNGKSLVIGTTGFSPEQSGQLNSSIGNIACVMAPNMSVGVNVMFEITERLARVLGDDYDIEIIEAHHKKKVDSPSGTALGLGRAAAKGAGRNFDKVAKFERHGVIGERSGPEIGIQTVRGGDIVGEHTVMFIGEGERIELTHRATSRDNFARGVVRAAKWIHGKPAGLYTMKDVLSL